MKEIKARYDEYGWVQILDVIPIQVLEESRQQLSQVIQQIAHSKGLNINENQSINEQYNMLCSTDRSLGGMVYDCMRFHPLMQVMSTQPKILEIVKALISPKLLFHVHDQLHFRIDRRNEDKFQLQWHQDYWYNNSSTYAVTVWIPLFDTSIDMGPMQIIDRSHTEAVKVKVDPNFKTNWDQNRLITLAKEIPLDKGNCYPCSAGSAIFMNALTLHRSGKNVSDKNRFTIVLRYADLFDPELIEKRWKMGIMPGQVSLLKTRPDLVDNLTELRLNGAL